MSRVRWVGRRLSEGFLFNAHKGCNGQQARSRETGCDDFVFHFHNCVCISYGYLVLLLQWRDLKMFLHSFGRYLAALSGVAARESFRSASRAFVAGNRLLYFTHAGDFPVGSAAVAEMRRDQDGGLVGPASRVINSRRHLVLALRTRHLRDFSGHRSGTVVPLILIEKLPRLRRRSDAVVACGFILGQHRAGEREHGDARQCRYQNFVYCFHIFTFPLFCLLNEILSFHFLLRLS